MARTADQMELGIVAEKFTEREKKIRALLREYRTIDRRIEYFERLSRGDGLSHEPRITPVAPVDENVFELAKQYRENHYAEMDERARRRLDKLFEGMSDAQLQMLDVLRKYLDPSLNHVTYAKVADILRNTFSDDAVEDETLQLAFVMFKEAAASEERVELTSTEKDAIIRESEIQQARQKLETLREHKRHVGYALDTMREYYHEDYLLLWHRDVMGISVADVCEAVGLNFLTEIETYKKRMRRAREEFAKWVPNHIVQT